MTKIEALPAMRNPFAQEGHIPKSRRFAFFGVENCVAKSILMASTEVPENRKIKQLRSFYAL